MIQLGALFCDCEPSHHQRSRSVPSVHWDFSGPIDRDPLTDGEIRAVLDQLAEYGVEAIRLRGIDPADRTRLDGLVRHAAELGLSTTLWIGGCDVGSDRLHELDRVGIDTLSVLVPGLSTPRTRHEADDEIDAALETLERAVGTDLATELRFPLRADSVTDLEEVYDLAALLDVDRFRLVHERGTTAAGLEDAPWSPSLTEGRRRQSVSRLCDVARDAHERDTHLRTVLDDDVDAAFVASYAEQRLDPAAATAVRDALADRLTAGPRPAVAKLDAAGSVYPGPAWTDYALGSLRDRPFGAIWTDESNPLLRRLRHREAAVPDRCLDCAFDDVCAGGSRGRALSAHADPFAPDPVCYVDLDGPVPDAHPESPAD